MYVVMRCFTNFRVPAMIFDTEERAIEYAKKNDNVYCTYTVEYVDYGGLNYGSKKIN